VRFPFGEVFEVRAIRLPLEERTERPGGQTRRGGCSDVAVAAADEMDGRLRAGVAFAEDDDLVSGGNVIDVTRIDPFGVRVSDVERRAEGTTQRLRCFARACRELIGERNV